MSELRARAEPCDPLEIRLDVGGGGFLFERGSEAVAGWGAAVHVTVPPGPRQVARAARAVRRALGRLPVEGHGLPVAVGALPFDGSWPATLVIPRVAVVRRGAEAYRVVVGERGPVAEPRPPRPPRRGPGLRLTPLPAPERYLQAVREARRRIRRGELEKVVLARMLVARAEKPFDRAALVERLRLREPAAIRFAVGGLVGATPELLVSRRGREVRAVPVAGTARRGPGAASRLRASAKDRREHAVVVEAVGAALAGHCETLDVPARPRVLALRSVVHLATEVRGRLAPPAPTALELAARLHPTPAVCGAPPAPALALIRELETVDRGLYAGAVGWVDAAGDGDWAVALRCAEVQGNLALLFAGAGIMADSDPEAELAETEAKLASMLDALAHA